MTRLDTEIGDILKRLRARPETIRTLAAKSGLSLAVVWRLKAATETGPLNFHVSVFRKIAAGLDRLDRESTVGTDHAA